jgi:hypothetical protein
MARDGKFINNEEAGLPVETPEQQRQRMEEERKFSQALEKISPEARKIAQLLNSGGNSDEPTEQVVLDHLRKKMAGKRIRTYHFAPGFIERTVQEAQAHVEATAISMRPFDETELATRTRLVETLSLTPEERKAAARKPAKWVDTRKHRN